MFNKAEILDLSRKILSLESSERAGTVLFEGLLKESFPNFEWSSLAPHGDATVHYTETVPNSKVIDLLCYVNGDTANPSHLSLWTETDFDPLSVTLKKGRLYGLGAAHEKMSLVPQLFALNAIIKANKFKNKNIVFAIGYGRENKMRGARRLLSEFIGARDISKICLGHPTNNEIFHGSSGRLKTKVFFPFSEAEKALRKEHDLKENISSQSKVFRTSGSDLLEGNSVFQMINSCKNLPKGTLVLDLDAGSSTATEPKTTYFELDMVAPFKDSMVSKFENFGEKLTYLNETLIERFKKDKPKRAIHIGRCFDSEEGVTFFGLNLIPAHTNAEHLDSWFEEFKCAVEEVGGEVSITDARAPYLNRNRNHNEKYCLNLTDASVFSKVCDDIVILGPGLEGAAQKPNESVLLDDLVSACSNYYELFENLIGEDQ